MNKYLYTSVGLININVFVNTWKSRGIRRGLERSQWPTCTSHNSPVTCTDVVVSGDLVLGNVKLKICVSSSLYVRLGTRRMPRVTQAGSLFFPLFDHQRTEQNSALFVFCFLIFTPRALLS